MPPSGPLLFVLNHPNSLIDPIFLFTRTPRPVSVLAKEPLFRMPVIGTLVRAMGSIPVERRQDAGADLRKNREMFVRVRKRLALGDAVALFPEGTSHSDPRLRPLRTGAARIALGVQSAVPLRIQPIGLFYTAKERFRSAALVYFGEAFEVEPAPLDENGDPSGDRVHALTDRIAASLAEVTLQADELEAHEFVARLERILASERRETDLDSRPDLSEEFAYRRRLLNGYKLLQQRDPERLERVRARVYRHEDRLRGAGVDPWDLPVGPFRARRGLGKLLFFLGRFLLYLPLGIPGVILHFLPYRLIGALARTTAKGSGDVLASTKLMSAAVVFPLTWILAAVIAWRWVGLLAALGALVLLPLSGYAALRLTETADRALGAIRTLGLWLVGRRRLVLLQVERRRLRDDVLRIAGELGV